MMNIDSTASRAARLRALLNRPEIAFIMEAHNGLSARIVEEAGFEGIWASGLCLSAQFGVRDNNEASWTQVVDVLEFMADASSLPILLDGDTGYGNFNNMRRLVKKLEQRAIAGVCIEDKLFPKKNSFIDGDKQELADIDEFCGKIKAGKDAQMDDDFCIVARVEALIAGWGQAEALKRAEAYRRAGADAILIHSRRSRPDEILEFAKAWANRSPLVIVPTKYYSTPTQAFRDAGISLVIWANHLLRAAASAMQSVAAEVHKSETLVDIEERVAPVSEIFRLQGAAEYNEAEKRYLKRSQTTNAIVLAAGRGEGLEALTEDRPKVMLDVAGKPLLGRLTDAFHRQHIRDITVVGGYKADAIEAGGTHLVLNSDFAETGELTSLACALDAVRNDTVITYGDLVFRHYILRNLLETEAELAVVVDSSDAAKSGTRDLAWCSRADARSVFGQDVRLERVAGGGHGCSSPASGRWIGMLHVKGAGRDTLLAAFEALRRRDDFRFLGLPELLNGVVRAGHAVRVVYVHGHWLDVNNEQDLLAATDFAHGQSSVGVNS
ncbi:MAG: phosphoenolpyruvate mutase [Nevskiaceae bacterium]|nr:MAG: phosphoenolpyruvate mutase [Nevskiaceae bacterium]TBR73744.1 MAG: phosphoenolpyruvate mutase [Nevskiaceae bacterium]